jgi:hypothetical protein
LIDHDDKHQAAYKVIRTKYFCQRADAYKNQQLIYIARHRKTGISKIDLNPIREINIDKKIIEGIW